ncbi:uncharacterized protein LOC126817241 [Patella vulgata]|uniref:uncharacterized protein LOC126817241 n=1 Tax=Patella vulgata TaxID=6465 RepID=UPI00218058B4|nr:uncharacterized protein LOC126817241 [Patella vulgata]
MSVDVVAIINRTDFMNATYESRKHYEDALRNWTMDIKARPAMDSVDEFCRIFRALTAKICTTDFQNEVGAKMVSVLIKRMSYEWSDVMFENHLVPLQELVIQFYIDVLKLGPREAHVCVVRSMLEPLYSYLEKCSVEKWKELLNLFREVFKSSPAEEFAKHLSDLFEILVEAKSEKKENLQTKFAELYLFFELNFLKEEKKVYDMYHSLGVKICYKYDRSVFKVAKDAEFYRSCLKYFIAILSDPGGPYEEDKIKQITSIFDKLKSGLQDSNMFEDICEDTIDFVLILSKKTDGPEADKVVEGMGYYYSRIKADTIKGKSAIFDKFAPKFLEFLETAENDVYCSKKMVESVLDNILNPTMNNTKEHIRLWLKIIKAGLHRNKSVKDIAHALKNKEKVLKWKDLKTEAKEFCDVFFKRRYYVKGDGWDERDITDGFNSILEELLKGFKKGKILKWFLPEVVDYTLAILEDKCVGLFECAHTAASECGDVNIKEHRQLIFDSLIRIEAIMKMEDFPWENWKSGRALTGLSEHLIRGLGDGKGLNEKEKEILASITLTNFQQDFIDPEKNEPGGVHCDFFFSLSDNLMKLLLNTGQLAKEDKIIELFLDILKREEEDIYTRAGYTFQTLGAKSAPIFAPYLDKLLDAFFENEQYSILSILPTAYQENPKPMKDYFQRLFEYVESSDSGVLSYLIQLLPHIAKKQPELFTEDNIEMYVEAMYNGEPTLQSLFLMSLEPLASKRPSLFKNQIDKFLERPYNEYAYYYLFKVLGILSAKYDQKVAEKILNFFLKFLKGSEDTSKKVTVVIEMKGLVLPHRTLIEKHRAFIEKLSTTGTDQNFKDQAKTIIDLLEGRSLETLADDIDLQQGEIYNLDTRVTSNENNINQVTEEVGRHSEQITEIRYDVDEQGNRINELGEVVDETVQKVEEIDQKTLSHAPYWSRDVCKLLNPKTEADWRLLSSRLGYSNDDIRGWSQQADPCMAMLNEWYATHKTSEATFGVFTALQEINRLDAAVIVENAMKAAEQVVEHEEFEYSTPPPIFLSYQWGHQQEVKLLRQHLEMAGYDCWMDIGQMGGGDKLFEKIDQGIRAAKVIISCTTEKYAKSPNCNREVNLAVNLKKSIIPLKFDSCPWPPPGSMGPIFSEYLFIMFYQRKKEEETNDERFWPVPKFQELLMQLSMNGVVPDESKVHKMYKKWWMPLVEEIKIDKSKTIGGGKNQNNENKSTTTYNQQVDKSPDVFISYQWGKQKNIMLLYKRLTELGYQCWMDIYQMGGGDSLYDKIDRGIRGCKVVVSCITEKYSLSANCRREVSLCDALKRPIIPILLENTTWPPRGPMSMAFTELLYIDFHSDPDVQEKWSGPKFEELRSKIREILPSVDEGVNESDDSEQNVNKNGNLITKKDIQSETQKGDVTKTTTSSFVKSSKANSVTKPVQTRVKRYTPPNENNHDKTKPADKQIDNRDRTKPADKKIDNRDRTKPADKQIENDDKIKTGDKQIENEDESKPQTQVPPAEKTEPSKESEKNPKNPPAQKTEPSKESEKTDLNPIPVSPKPKNTTSKSCILL